MIVLKVLKYTYLPHICPFLAQNVYFSVMIYISIRVISSTCQQGERRAVIGHLIFPELMRF